jgi:hypothetical protein
LEGFPEEKYQNQSSVVSLSDILVGNVPSRPVHVRMQFVLIEYNNDKIEEFVLDGNPQDIQENS